MGASNSEYYLVYGLKIGSRIRTAKLSPIKTLLLSRSGKWGEALHLIANGFTQATRR